MAKWVTIAEGTGPGDLRSTGVIEELPHGTPFKIIIDIREISLGFMKLSPAKVFDLVSAEWAADRLYNEAGAILEDVEAVGNQVIMHMRANFVITTTLIAAVAGVLLAVSLLIVAIKIKSPEKITEDISKIVMFAVAGLAILAILYFVVQKKGIGRLAGG